MKSLFLIFLSIFSIQAYSTTCLIVNGHEKLCSKKDVFILSQINCTDTIFCYLGDKDDLIQKLNSGIFTSIDSSIGDAKKISDNSISFLYGNVGNVCEFTLNSCE